VARVSGTVLGGRHGKCEQKGARWAVAWAPCTTRGAVVAYSSKTDGEEADALQAGIASFGAAVLANETLLRDLDDIMVDLVSTAVERYRTEIGDLIAGTVAGWDPEATSERFELAVGRDLQFVRINGTLVGALVGLVLYTLSQLFW
jgi:uncharacterized membrane-anchored protein YjiN (DUF445 family)